MFYPCRDQRNTVKVLGLGSRSASREGLKDQQLNRAKEAAKEHWAQEVTQPRWNQS